MARPGVIVSTRNAPPASGPPIKTGTAFFVGPALKGEVGVAKLVESMADFERLYGTRVTYSFLHPSVDAFFREGGGSAYISRVVGDSVATASFSLQDATNAASILVKAKGPGVWGNSLKVAVASSGGTITLTITDAANVVLESYATTGGKQAFLDYTGFQYVTLSDADPTKGDPKVTAATALSGGTDDTATIDGPNYVTALSAFGGGLGPGQVLAPGVTDGATHAALLDHAKNNNRVALLDAPDTNVLATIEAAATAATATGNGSYGGMFAPHVKVPGDATGTSRKVPYSAIQAGVEARRDRIASPNIPAAGRSYPLNWAQSLVYEFTDANRTELITYGVNVARSNGGFINTYGYRSLANAASEPYWTQLNYARLRMAITARGYDVGESFVFAQMDGKGLKLSEFGSAIAGMLLDFYVLGSLYGDTPDEAFRVDVGPSINTAETISAGELHAVAAVRMSPHAELVVIEFVKTPITQAV